MRASLPIPLEVELMSLRCVLHPPRRRTQIIVRPSLVLKVLQVEIPYMKKFMDQQYGVLDEFGTLDYRRPGMTLASETRLYITALVVHVSLQIGKHAPFSTR